MNDEHVRAAFSNLRFDDEPPTSGTIEDDVARGMRRLRRRRVTAWSSGVAGLAVIATSVVATALPGGETPSNGNLPVAGGADIPPVESRAPSSRPTPSPAGSHELPFPATRQLLLDTAAKHFDPARVHLPDGSTGFTGGGYFDVANVGTKIDWTNPGESGMGLVQIAVTEPGFATADTYARQDFTSNLGCDMGTATCTEQTVPGTDKKVLVAQANPDLHLLSSVIYERADGSMVGVGVYDLFGNNSNEPVSHVDISLDQAFAFVTDSNLKVDPSEANTNLYDMLNKSGTATGPTSATAEALSRTALQHNQAAYNSLKSAS